MSMTCKFKYNSSKIQLIFKSFYHCFLFLCGSIFKVFFCLRFLLKLPVYITMQIFFFSVPGVEKLEFYHLKLEYFYYAMDTLMININVSKKVFLVLQECLMIRIIGCKNFK